MAIAIAWALVFMIFLYSPVGSPELYHPVVLSDESRYEIFYNSIPNSPRGRGSSSFSDYSAPEMSSPFSGIGTAQNSNVVSVSNVGSASMYSAKNEQIASSGMSGGGSLGGVASGSRSGKGSESSVGSLAFTPFSNSISPNSGGTRQMANYAPSSGGLDPGDDPTDPPIPIGDGNWILIVLIFPYICWKFYKQKLAKA